MIVLSCRDVNWVPGVLIGPVGILILQELQTEGILTPTRSRVEQFCAWQPTIGRHLNPACDLSQTAHQKFPPGAGINIRSTIQHVPAGGFLGINGSGCKPAVCFSILCCMESQTQLICFGKQKSVIIVIMTLMSTLLLFIITNAVFPAIVPTCCLETFMKCSVIIWRLSVIIWPPQINQSIPFAVFAAKRGLLSFPKSL